MLGIAVADFFHEVGDPAFRNCKSEYAVRFGRVVDVYLRAIDGLIPGQGTDNQGRDYTDPNYFPGTDNVVVGQVLLAFTDDTGIPTPLKTPDPPYDAAACGTANQMPFVTEPALLALMAMQADFYPVAGILAEAAGTAEGTVVGLEDSFNLLTQAFYAFGFWWRPSWRWGYARRGYGFCSG